MFTSEHWSILRDAEKQWSVELVTGWIKAASFRRQLIDDVELCAEVSHFLATIVVPPYYVNWLVKTPAEIFELEMVALDWGQVLFKLCLCWAGHIQRGTAKAILPETSLKSKAKELDAEEFDRLTGLQPDQSMLSQPEAITELRDETQRLVNLLDLNNFFDFARQVALQEITNELVVVELIGERHGSSQE